MNKKFGVSAIFATFLIVTVVLVPAVSATTEDNKSDIINNIEFDKKLLDFNDTLDNFETVTTNPTTFLNDVSDGRVTFELLGQKFDLKLQKMHVVSDNATITAADGSISDAPKSDSYNGTVVGKTNSSVVLTAGDGVLIGEINVDNESYYIDQTAKKYNNKVIHIVYSSDDIKKGNILTYDSVIIDPKALTTPSLTQTQIKNLLLSVPTVDIMACYDSEFLSHYTSPATEISNMMATVKSAFSAGNCNLNIKTYKMYTVSSGTSSTVLTSFKSVAASDRDSTNSDLAFLFTGKEMSGDDIGRGYQYSGNSNYAYAIAQMVSAGSGYTYQATLAERKALITHELGHNFGANHNEAYSWTSGSSTYYTSMTSPFKGSTMRTEFSNLNNHGTSTRNNILHIVANKGTIAGFQ